MNVYRVVDIYLQQDEEYQALSQLTQSHMMIYIGYNEMTNQRLLELLYQLLEYRRDKITYIFIKGTTPITQSLMSTVKYPKLYLDKVTKQEEVF